MEINQKRVNNTPYFIEEGTRRYVPGRSLKGNIKTPFLVVGGGITGISTAYALTKTGVKPKDITVIDSGRVGFSTTGHSSGLLVDSVEEDFCDTDSRVHSQVKAGVDGIVRTVATESLDCDLIRAPSFYIARNADQREDVKREYLARSQAGFEVSMIDGRTLLERHGIQAVAAMKNQEGYCIDPLAFCKELSRKLQEAGAQVYEETCLIENDPRQKKVTTQNRATIDYEKIILTNNSPTLSHGLLKNRAILLSSATGVTAPLTAEQYEDMVRSQQIMGWDAADGSYSYFRTLPGRRILVGGADRLVSLREASAGIKTAERDFSELRKILERTFPGARNVQFSNLWTGIIPASVDTLSLVGETERDNYIALYSAGLPISFRTGEVVADLVQGRKGEEHELFRSDRPVPLMKRAAALTKYEPITTIANRLCFS